MDKFGTAGTLATLAATAMIGAAVATPAPAGDPPIFDGRLGYTALTEPCVTYGGFSKADLVPFVIRPQVLTIFNRGGGFQIMGNTGALVFIVPDAKQLPVGKSSGSFLLWGVSPKVGIYGAYAAPYSLTLKYTDGGKTANLTGTVSNWANIAGCVATIKASGKMR